MCVCVHVCMCVSVNFNWYSDHFTCISNLLRYLFNSPKSANKSTVECMTYVKDVKGSAKVWCGLSTGELQVLVFLNICIVLLVVITIKFVYP